MSRFHDVAYIRNSDIIDRSEDKPTQVGFILQDANGASNALLNRNYSTIHALPSNSENSNSKVFYIMTTFVLLFFDL